MPRIPPEILEIIIGCLSSSEIDLKACSIVARSWLPIARAHFFRVVLTPINVDEFNDLATCPCSFIPSTLRDLALTRNWEPIQITHFPCLPKVVCLVIHNMHFSSNSLYPVIDQLPSLTHLYLDEVSFDSFPQVARVICTFRHLEVLSLSDVAWSNSSEPLNTFEPAKSLHTLSVALCYQHDIFSWLLSLSTVPVIPRLNLSNSVAPSSIPSVARYFLHLSHRLETLRLGFSSFDAGGDAEDFLAAVDLRFNASGLRQLWIDSFVGKWEITQVTTSAPWVLDMLEQLKGTEGRLEVLHFGIDGDVDGEACEVDWDRLDQLLGQLRVPSAWFWVSEDAGDFHEIEMSLKKRLKGSTRRGVVHVANTG